ncbi:MAG: response regulator transcription factor [Bdellovibrionales bacterium]
MLREVLLKEGLSNRETEVAELVTQGLSNKEVANRLFVTEKTVKFHLTNIYKKMNVKSRAQLIVWCLPNMTFVERKEQSQGVQDINAGNQGAGPSQTIPAGHAPVNSEAGTTTEEVNIIAGQFNNKTGY